MTCSRYQLMRSRSFRWPEVRKDTVGKGGGYAAVSLMMIVFSLVGAKLDAQDNDDDGDARFVLENFPFAASFRVDCSS